MNSVLVLGANGQVGRALGEVLGKSATLLDREKADLSKPSSLTAILEKFKPSAVFNAAAYTQVDLAEKERDLAFAINGEAPGVIARFCAARDIPLVHYSTDYVFSGEGSNPRHESDPTSPLSVYGTSKLEGETQIKKNHGKYLIFRTSWVYDRDGKNFVNTMLRLGKEREKLTVVSDQIGAPTYAPDLAKASVQGLENALAKAQFPSGIYHLCNSGETSWHGFAKAIFAEARALQIPLRVSEIAAIPTSQYPTPAKRPGNSRLSTEKAKLTLGISLRPWEDALKECLKGHAL